VTHPEPEPKLRPFLFSLSLGFFFFLSFAINRPISKSRYLIFLFLFELLTKNINRVDFKSTQNKARFA
jgi:hypothetical protein